MHSIVAIGIFYVIKRANRITGTYRSLDKAKATRFRLFQSIGTSGFNIQFAASEYVSFPDTRHGFDTDAEIKNFVTHLTSIKELPKTPQNTKPMELPGRSTLTMLPTATNFEKKVTAKEFENIENIENLESMHVSLDANIDFPNTSKCLALKSIVIDSTETIHCLIWIIL